MKKRPIVAVFDGNWYFHRVWHVLQKRIETTSNPQASMCYSLLAKFCVDALAIRADFVVVSFDGPEVFRYDLFSEYKGQRGDNSDVYEFLHACIKYLRDAGLLVVQRKKFEADDVLNAIAKRYSPTHKVVCGTRDKDAFQYLQPNVVLYDSSFKDKHNKPAPRYITAADVEDTLVGLPPSLMVQYQALVGDGIDNIPKILTPAKAKNGLLKYGSIKNWCLKDKEVRNLLVENRDQLMLNRKLVQLRDDCLPKDFELAPIQQSKSANLPKSYYGMLDLMNPKSRGLF